jgi:hypothetical protein
MKLHGSGLLRGSLATLILLVAGGFVFLGEPASGGDATPPPAVSPSRRVSEIIPLPPVKGGPRPDLVIFYSGEVSGWTEPCG